MNLFASALHAALATASLGKAPSWTSDPPDPAPGTAARGALALSALPLLTMAVAGVLRVEPFTRRKTIGVLVAMAGVGLALLSGLRTAPPDAWRGDLLMLAAALAANLVGAGLFALLMVVHWGRARPCTA